MVVWKRTKKSTCCLLFARFLFVNLFIAVASLFTWRGRREGVSWVGEPISWKFGDFLSCIQYLWVQYSKLNMNIYHANLSHKSKYYIRNFQNDFRSMLNCQHDFRNMTLCHIIYVPLQILFALPWNIISHQKSFRKG